MPETILHCKIDENAFSWALFLNRLFTGFSLLYITVGSFLFHREFLYNATALGLPAAVPLGITVLVAEMFLALFLILGWFTRIAAVLSFICTLALGFIFFADINKIFIALGLFLLAALILPVLLGPGKISLDFSHACRRSQKKYRG